MSAKPAEFEVDLDDPMRNPILLEELRRLPDGVDSEILDDKPDEVVEEERHKAELIEENEQHKLVFWKMHLDYNLDDLIGGL